MSDYCSLPGLLDHPRQYEDIVKKITDLDHSMPSKDEESYKFWYKHYTCKKPELVTFHLYQLFHNKILVDVSYRPDDSNILDIIYGRRHLLKDIPAD